jgi:hypothetical protein
MASAVGWQLAWIYEKSSHVWQGGACGFEGLHIRLGMKQSIIVMYWISYSSYIWWDESIRVCTNLLVYQVSMVRLVPLVSCPCYCGLFPEKHSKDRLSQRRLELNSISYFSDVMESRTLKLRGPIKLCSKVAVDCQRIERKLSFIVPLNVVGQLASLVLGTSRWLKRWRRSHSNDWRRKL